MPELLYSEVIEVDERVVLRQKSCQLNLPCSLQTGITGEQVSHSPSTLLTELASLCVRLILIKSAPINQPVCGLKK